MTTATRSRTVRATNIGPSSAIEALMVRIDWTSAQIVRVEARKDITIQAATVAILKHEYTVMKHVQVEVPAERVLYFCRSSFDGWYYLLMYSEAQSRFDCTCPSGRLRHNCGHAVVTAEYADQRTQREQAREALRASAVAEPATLTETRPHVATQTTQADKEQARRFRDRVTAELALFQSEQLDRAS